MTINIKGLTVEFNNGTKAIDNLNLNIEKGIYGLLGENGAGKTTLMRVLTTILPVSKGNILINGINLEKNNYENDTETNWISTSGVRSIPKLDS